jgi:hypothetical protein
MLVSGSIKAYQGRADEIARKYGFEPRALLRLTVFVREHVSAKKTSLIIVFAWLHSRYRQM